VPIATGRETETEQSNVRQSGRHLNDLVSICIPTYKRPKLLAAALDSCLTQSYKRLEIVIGDDSPDTLTEGVAERYRTLRDWSVSYKRHAPALGQNANVNDLFSRANGDRLILLHDDDLLLAGAVADLATLWESYPDLVVAFGNQEVISSEGVHDPVATEALSREFFRAGNQGLISNSMRSALKQQMPNDGFMIRTDFARQVGYRSHESVGVNCDLDFSLRLGAALGNYQMYLVERTISQYRLSAQSISRTIVSRKSEHPRAARALLKTIESLPIPAELNAEKRYLIGRFIQGAVKSYATAGERRTALNLFMSREYSWARRLSRRGLYQLALIVNPSLDRLRKYE